MSVMKKLLPGFSVVLLSSCSQTTIPSLAQTTKIQVVGAYPTSLHSKSKPKVKYITNKSHIVRIVGFVDKRRSGWYRPLDTLPAANGSALVFYHGQIFYHGQKEIHVLAVGSHFFSAHGEDKWFLKNVSPQEKQELLNLIGSKS